MQYNYGHCKSKLLALQDGVIVRNYFEPYLDKYSVVLMYSGVDRLEKNINNYDIWMIIA